MRLSAPARLRGVVRVPGDKSISHRALVLSALASGTSRIAGRAMGEDQESMVRCLRDLGVGIDAADTAATVTGVGLRSLRQPTDDLDCGNSGNTMRFLIGALAATPDVSARLVGDASLSRRPMARVADPLNELGADVRPAPGGTPPVDVDGVRLRGGMVTIRVPSAQVKTAVLLAALQGDGVTAVIETTRTRDHTERLLRRLGVDLQVGEAITLRPPARLEAFELKVPGDPSAAAFWAVLAACHPDADIEIEGVCVNPTRAGFLEVLRRMGASIDASPERDEAGEPVVDMRVRSSQLTGADIPAAEVPTLVDEVPVLAVAAACAAGKSRFAGLAELRQKETDRLAAIQDQLARMGVAVAIEGDDLVISGPCRLRGATVSALGDHRMAMSLAVAACLASGDTEIDGSEAANVSYPGFFAELSRLSQDL